MKFIIDSLENLKQSSSWIKTSKAYSEYKKDGSEVEMEKAHIHAEVEILFAQAFPSILPHWCHTNWDML